MISSITAPECASNDSQTTAILLPLTPPVCTVARGTTAIVDQFNALDPLPDPDKTGYREAIDDWMRKVRG